MKLTTNLGLKKPDGSDIVDISDLNYNSDVIDNKMATKEELKVVKDEINISANTKYTTSKGVKEFTCKGGYVDNIAIQGQTKILNASNVEVSPGTSGAKLVSVGQGDKIEVLTHNTSNLFDGILRQGAYSQTDGTFNNSIVSTANLNSISVSNSKIYLTTTETNRQMRLIERDSSKSFVTSQLIDLYSGINEVDLNSNTKFIDFHLGRVNGVDVYTPNSKIVISSSIFKYDKKQISTTLRSLPNSVKDEIVQQGDRYYKIIRCGEYVVTGNEVVVHDITSTNTVQVSIPINNAKKNADLDIVISNSDKFVGRSRNQFNANDSEAVSITGSGNITFKLLKSKATDLNSAKIWLSSNNVTVVYELATPQITEIPNPNPRTFADKTTFLLNTGVVQGEASFEVTNSLGSALEVMADKISGLDDNLYEVFDVQLMNGYDIPEWAERPKIIKKGNMCFLHMLFAFNGTILDNIPISKIPSSCIPKSLIRNTFVAMKDNKTLIEGAFDIANDGYFRLWSANYVVDRNTTHLRVNTFWYVD